MCVWRAFLLFTVLFDVFGHKSKVNRKFICFSLAALRSLRMAMWHGFRIYKLHFKVL